MERLPTRQLRLLLGLAVLVSLGLLSFRGIAGGTHEVGTLEPIHAAPVEVPEVVELGPGETLGAVLGQAGALSSSERSGLLLAFQEQASPRRMSVGTEITLRFQREDRSLRGIDVTLNPDETVRLTRDDFGWSSRRIRTPVRTDTIFVAGEIETLLWNSVLGNEGLRHLPPRDRALLIHRMDQVFQWQVDFSRQIRTGDRYRFVFERAVRPDGSMRSGRILAAELENRGTSYHAIWFDPTGDGEGTYYDLEGESVRRAFLRRPLEYRRISSNFSRSRFHPIRQEWRAHSGVDYAAASGTPVQTTADGVVVHRGPRGGYGNLVEIRHSNGFTTRYAHLRGFASGVHVGTRVRQGQVIGYVGATGLATGPHLHYELRRNGTALDPLAIELPEGAPVPEEAWEEWEEQVEARSALLDRLPGSPILRVAVREGGAASDRGADQDL